jgi:hypothetical protein
MFDEIKKNKNNGHFFFKKGDNLKQVSKTVPDLPGVYYIIRLSNGQIELVYIGKSGLIRQNGQFKDQGINSCLNNKQGVVFFVFNPQHCKQASAENKKSPALRARV